VKSGEVDMAFLFGGPVAEDLKRSPGMRIQAPLLYGVYWLDFLDQWDPKSPWHDKRVRQAASLAIDRNAINQAEMLGLGKATSAFVPPEFEFSMKFETTPFDPKRAKQLLAEAGYANGLDAGDITPLPPYTTVGETVSGMLQAVGIKSRVRTMERATYLSSWREKKIKGLLIGATGAAGNAAARLEPFFTQVVARQPGIEPKAHVPDLHAANEVEPSDAAVVRKGIGRDRGAGADAMRQHAAAAVVRLAAVGVRDLERMAHGIDGDGTGPPRARILHRVPLQQQQRRDQRNHWLGRTN